jgi:hypothetical protein
MSFDIAWEACQFTMNLGCLKEPTNHLLEQLTSI